MTFEEWLIENGHDENGEYPSQYFYSASEWDTLFEEYEEECGGQCD